MQVRKIRARVHEGKLELLEPLNLPEEAVVSVSVEYAEEGDARDAFRAAAGGWKDLVPDTFLAEVYEERRVHERADAEL